MRPVILGLLLLNSALGAISHVKSVAGTSTAAGLSTTFSYTANATGDGVIFAISCADGGTPTGVSLTATGWTLTQVHGVTGSTSVGWMASYRAYAPNTSAATFTMTWTHSGGNCANFFNWIIDEWAGMDATNFVDASSSGNGSGTPSSSVTPVSNNTAILGVCNDTVTAVGNIAGSAATKGGDDAGGDWSEYRIISGGAGASQAIGFTGSGAWNMLTFALKPAATGGTQTFHYSGVM